MQPALITWAGLRALFAEISAPSLNAKIINFAITWQLSEPGRLAGIPVLWCRDPAGNFPSYHACRAVRWMNQSRNRTTGSTPLFRTVSNPYIKMAAPGWPGSYNTKIKVTSAELPSRLMQLGPHCELYCNAVCTWKNWNILKFGLDPRSWTLKNFFFAL